MQKINHFPFDNLIGSATDGVSEKLESDWFDWFSNLNFDRQFLLFSFENFIFNDCIESDRTSCNC